MKRIVILYSGGLDSFLLKKYANIMYPEAEVKCLYYKHGADSEIQEIKRLPPFVEVRTVEWLGEKIKPLPKKEDPFAGNIYIPGRNLIFASLAACQELPGEIWMGTVWDEDNEKGTDKNEYFRSKTSELLTYVLSPFIDKIELRFPFVELKWTKRDSVRWALENGISKDNIKATVSCWNQKDERPCGECKQCFKRELVFLLNGIAQDYRRDPMKSNNGKQLLRMYIETGLDNKIEKNKDEKNVFNMIMECYENHFFDIDTMDYIKGILNEFDQCSYCS